VLQIDLIVAVEANSLQQQSLVAGELLEYLEPLQLREVTLRERNLEQDS
jgi:hypothetical protein